MEFVTTKQHRYRGKIQKVGDKYEIAGKSDARLVQALGWSVPAPVVAPVVVREAAKVAAPAIVMPVAEPAPVVIEPIAEPAPEVITEAAPEPEPAPEARPDTDKPKRAYKRRDLSAE